MQRHVLAALFSERYVRYFGFLHPAFEMSRDIEYLKKTVLFSWAKQKLSETTLSTFQKCLFELCSAWFFGCKKKQLFWEHPEVSLLGTIRVFCSNAESLLGCASFWTPRLVLWLFTSCVWDVWRYRSLIKLAFDFFRKRGLRRFVLCAIVLMIFAQTFRKILGDFSESKTQNFQNDVEYVPKMSVWAMLYFFLWS